MLTACMVAFPYAYASVGGLGASCSPPAPIRSTTMGRSSASATSGARPSRRSRIKILDQADHGQGAPTVLVHGYLLDGRSRQKKVICFGWISRPGRWSAGRWTITSCRSAGSRPVRSWNAGCCWRPTMICRPSTPRARHRVPRRPAPHRCPATRCQEETGRGGAGIGHHNDRDLWSWPSRRGHRPPGWRIQDAVEQALMQCGRRCGRLGWCRSVMIRSLHPPNVKPRTATNTPPTRARSAPKVRLMTARPKLVGVSRGVTLPLDAKSRRAA
jgi:hypothetical protein